MQEDRLACAAVLWEQLQATKNDIHTSLVKIHHSFVSALSVLSHKNQLLQSEIDQLKRTLDFYKQKEREAMSRENVFVCWKLKYSSEDAGSLTLCELVPGSGVYVEELELVLCKCAARDYPTLATSLVEHLCSPAAEPQPEHLVAHLQTTIFRFLERHGRENSWSELNDDTVVSVNTAIYDKLARMNDHAIEALV